nr:MAG TPA: hypothetical protein [Caudoviricetes sp.]
MGVIPHRTIGDDSIVSDRWNNPLLVDLPR